MNRGITAVVFLLVAHFSLSAASSAQTHEQPSTDETRPTDQPAPTDRSEEPEPPVSSETASQSEIESHEAEEAQDVRGESTGEASGDDVSVQAAENKRIAQDAPDEPTNEVVPGKPGDKEGKPKKISCYSCDALDTRLSGRLLSEVYLMQRARARILGNGVYGKSTLRVLPFYETIELRADELYHKGLSVHFQGWTGFDLNDVYFDDRAEGLVADPTYLYVQFQAEGFRGKAGRQMVYTGATRGLHIDGIHASYQLPILVGIEGLAGLVVSPYRGPSWYREQPAVDFDSFGPGFSDWEREGEYAIGSRLFYRRTGIVSGGISILHVTELDETATQLIGTDLNVAPVDWFAAYLNAAWDAPTSAIQQIDLELDFDPLDILSLSAQYTLTDPTLFLSHMSIFSIFSSEQYHSLGGTARIDPLDWLQVHAGYRHHLYNYDESEAEDGFEFFTGVTFQYLEQEAGTIVLNYRRLTESLNGLHQLRTGVVIPFAIPGLKAETNLYLDIYDQEVNLEKLGFIGDVGLFYSAGILTAGGSISTGSTPYDEEEIRGMLRLAYNFDHSFVERRHP